MSLSGVPKKLPRPSVPAWSRFVWHPRESIRDFHQWDAVRRGFYLGDVRLDVCVLRFHCQFSQEYGRDLRVRLETLREGEFARSPHCSGFC